MDVEETERGLTLSETQTNSNTRKALSKTQYTNMGKLNCEARENNGDFRHGSKTTFANNFSVTSQEKSKLNLEKTITAEQKMQKVTNPISVPAGSKVSAIMNEILNTRTYIVEQISETLEKKLEKLDEAIVELISCKTENERLKGKIDNLTRENYRLKKEVESFKSLMPGIYVKIKKDTINL